MAAIPGTPTTSNAARMTLSESHVDDSRSIWSSNPHRLARRSTSSGHPHRRPRSNIVTRASSTRINRQQSQVTTASAHSTSEQIEERNCRLVDQVEMLAVPRLTISLDQQRIRSISQPPLSTTDDNTLLEASSLPARWHQIATHNDPWSLPAIPSVRTRPLSMLSPRPRASISRLSSLDNVLTYREEVLEWRRTSSLLNQRLSFSNLEARFGLDEEQHDAADITDAPTVTVTHMGSATDQDLFGTTPLTVTPRPGTLEIVSSTAATEVASINEDNQNGRGAKFRHPTAHVGFVASISLMMLLSEYLISGFAIELSNLITDEMISEGGGMGTFWPATLLTLTLSATLLIFARLADRYGGYPLFMFGTLWLMIWTLIPGFSQNVIVIDIARAMQGLACAAFVPSTFSMMGVLYPDGNRYRNIVFGIYSACAPLGFFLGFLASGLLPDDKPEWYFWIGTVVSFIALVAAYLAVPHDKTDRRRLDLELDWAGALLLTSGLILIAYALAQYPYINRAYPSENAFVRAGVLAPFVAGLVCLLIAGWVEGWHAKSPLLPLDFFRPKSILPFCLAGLCFYAAYGVWLYSSAELFQRTGVHDGKLALWYVPMAVGGLAFAVLSGHIIDRVPVMIILLFSAAAWIAAPLLLALSPLPLPYWAFVFPSMICATAGIDLTYTISVIFLSAVQPLKYQGLAGAACSILVNLAMSFSLSVSEIVMTKTQQSGFTIKTPQNDLERENGGLQASLLYATASSGVGFVICVLFVRISRKTLSPRPVDEENRSRPHSSEAPTLVGLGDEEIGVQQRGRIETYCCK